jgi:inhibitor of cysteine peptidase
MAQTTINATSGKEFNIIVKSNPTTGYSWEPSYDDKFVSLTGQDYQRTSSAIGSGGTLELSFLPLKPGMTRIVLSLKRPWEEEIVETMEYDVMISISSQPVT